MKNIKGLLINYEKDEHAANDINHLIEMKDEAVPFSRITH